MLAKRIIPCLDIKDGRTVKGIQFEQLKDAGDPVELAALYAQQGADELVFLDITATHEKRQTLAQLAKEVAAAINIPFTIGGGVRSVADAERLLLAGADKVSINSAAVRRPAFITELAQAFGSQFVVVAIDAKQLGANWWVHLNGGRIATERQLFEWAQECQERGAGELLFTSMNHDGAQTGFACSANRQLTTQLHIPIIASGGAGSMDHFRELFQTESADAGLAASIFHYGKIAIPELKQFLNQHNIPIRL
ncbi:MAG: imidazole glycerol phosphate synthase subunit HisF [Phaeodactylibacter sp.]|nr:imidazole glycerol phosphate synthase subunit HisF [Phaeodactylibacter sp.]